MSFLLCRRIRSASLESALIELFAVLIASSSVPTMSASKEKNLLRLRPPRSFSATTFLMVYLKKTAWLPFNGLQVYRVMILTTDGQIAQAVSRFGFKVENGQYVRFAGEPCNSFYNSHHAPLSALSTMQLYTSSHAILAASHAQ